MCIKAEWSAEVAIGPPRFDFPPGILDRQELIGVETFIAQLADRLTGCNEGHHIFSDRDEKEQSMARKSQPNAASDAANVKLPGAALHMAGEHPEVWEAFQHLGEKASRAGPLDARTRRLIHLALAIAAGSEGATHSHARRASPEGISPEELEHVAVLAITTVGWSQAMKGLTWVRDITRPRPGAPASEPLEP